MPLILYHAFHPDRHNYTFPIAMSTETMDFLSELGLNPRGMTQIGSLYHGTLRGYRRVYCSCLHKMGKIHLLLNFIINAKCGKTVLRKPLIVKSKNIAIPSYILRIHFFFFFLYFKNRTCDKCLFIYA